MPAGLRAGYLVGNGFWYRDYECPVSDIVVSPMPMIISSTALNELKRFTGASRPQDCPHLGGAELVCSVTLELHDIVS